MNSDRKLEIDGWLLIRCFDYQGKSLLEDYRWRKR